MTLIFGCFLWSLKTSNTCQQKRSASRKCIAAYVHLWLNHLKLIHTVPTRHSTISLNHSWQDQPTILPATLNTRSTVFFINFYWSQNAFLKTVGVEDWCNGIGKNEALKCGCAKEQLWRAQHTESKCTAHNDFREAQWPHWRVCKSRTQ